MSAIDRVTRARLLVLLAPLCACGRDPGGDSAAGTAQRTVNTRPAAPLSYWRGTQAADVAQYPAPTAVTTVPRAPDIPRVVLARASGKAIGAARNTAVEIEVLGSGMQPAIFGSQAPAGTTFMVLDTRWRNVHSKQRMDKGASEGKVDRTMGVGGFAGGKSGGSAADSIDVDVAYQVPKLFDHVYLVSDGAATALHTATEEIPGGARINEAFTIARFGQTRDARFAFVIPGNAKNVALKFFDYEYGHILVPIRGNAESAAGSGAPSGKVLAKAQTAKLDLAAHALSFKSEFNGSAAPQGWRYALVQLGGRSRSSSGKVGDIVQIDPLKFIWLEGNGGYVYPSTGGSTTGSGLLRFTPEMYQTQEVAFLVPANADRFRVGLRAENEVARLAITDKKPDGVPRARGAFKDGNTMEVMVIGTRQEGDNLIADLAVKPLDTKGQGIEITPEQQFIIVTGAGEVQADMSASWNRLNKPPQPFVVPPDTPVRFELVFPGRAAATGLKIRGFESEGQIKL